MINSCKQENESEITHEIPYLHVKEHDFGVKRASGIVKLQPITRKQDLLTIQITCKTQKMNQIVAIKIPQLHILCSENALKPDSFKFRGHSINKKIPFLE